MTVSWLDPVSGDWSDGGNWSTDEQPVENANVAISVPGTYTVTLNTSATIASLILSDSGALFDVANTLTLTGEADLTGGVIKLESDGTISGGTIALAGGNFDFYGGTLSGVTLWGALDLTPGSGTVTIANSIKLRGANGTGPGTINVSETSYLGLQNVADLNNATINLAGQMNAGSSGQTTFGSDLSIIFSGDNAWISGNTIVNDGSIGGSGTLGDIPENLINRGKIWLRDGTIMTSGGGITNEASGTITGSGMINGIGIDNNAKITVNQGKLTLETELTGTGSLIIDQNSTLDLAIYNSLPDSQNIIFNGSGAALILDYYEAAPSSQTLEGFGAGDALILAGIGLSAATISGNTLTVTSSEATSTFNSRATYSFINNLSLNADVLITAPDGNGGTRAHLTQASLIWLGSTAEIIAAGSATNLTIKSTTANAGALINGNSPAATTLEITNGGTAKLNAETTNVTVLLEAANTSLVLSSMGFVTANGASGGDTIRAMASNQTLIGGAGDTLVGYSGDGDSFMGTTSALNHDIIAHFAGTDVIDVTNLNSATATLQWSATSTWGKLTLFDGVNSTSITLLGTSGDTQASFALAADGHGGTLVSLT